MLYMYKLTLMSFTLHKYNKKTHYNPTQNGVINSHLLKKFYNPILNFNIVYNSICERV